MLEILLVIMSIVAGVAVGVLLVRENMARATIADLKLSNHRRALQIKELEARLEDMGRVKEGLI